MGAKTLEELFASLEGGFGTGFVPKPIVGNIKIRPGQSPSRQVLLTDREWTYLGGYIRTPPKPWRRRDRKGGRPRADDRMCLEAAIWLMVNGRSLRRLPKRYGTRSTIQRRLTQWDQAGILERMWHNYLEGRRSLRIPIKPRRGFWNWTLNGVALATCRV